MEDTILNDTSYHLSGLKERLREDFYVRPDILITAKVEDDVKLYHIIAVSGLRRFDLGTYTTFKDAQNAIKGIHNMLELIVEKSPILKGGCE